MNDIRRIGKKRVKDTLDPSGTYWQMDMGDFLPAARIDGPVWIDQNGNEMYIIERPGKDPLSFKVGVAGDYRFSKGVIKQVSRKDAWRCSLPTSTTTRWEQVGQGSIRRSANEDASFSLPPREEQ